jgi:hypothetical protein
MTASCFQRCPSHFWRVFANPIVSCAHLSHFFRLISANTEPYRLEFNLKRSISRRFPHRVHIVASLQKPIMRLTLSLLLPLAAADTTSRNLDQFLNGVSFAGCNNRVGGRSMIQKESHPLFSSFLEYTAASRL